MQKFLNTDKLFSMTLWKAKNVNVFLLLDCADERGAVSKAINENPQLEAAPLYMGTKDEGDADIGPHLIKMTRDSQLMQWFLEEGADTALSCFPKGARNF